MQVISRDILTFSSSWPMERPRYDKSIWPAFLESPVPFPSIFLLYVVLLSLGKLYFFFFLSCSIFIFSSFFFIDFLHVAFGLSYRALIWTMWHQWLSILFLLCPHFCLLNQFSLTLHSFPILNQNYLLFTSMRSIIDPFLFIFSISLVFPVLL